MESDRQRVLSKPILASSADPGVWVSATGSRRMVPKTHQRTEVRRYGRYGVFHRDRHLDRLLGGLRIGDNLVWEMDSGAYTDRFIERFAHHSLSAGHNLIYVSFNRSPMTIARKLFPLPNQENITLLDCFTSGKGGDDSTFTRFYDLDHLGKIDVIRVEDPADVSRFTEALNDIEEEKGEGTRYVFDSMTGMQDLWGDEAKTYRMFTSSCPKLYDLDTI